MSLKLCNKNGKIEESEISSMTEGGEARSILIAGIFAILAAIIGSAG